MLDTKELIDEVVALAKRYGIATPYTSHLVVPDAPMPIVRPEPRPGDPKRDPSPVPLSAPVAGGGFGGATGPGGVPPGIPMGKSGKPGSVAEFAKDHAKEFRGD